MLGRMTRGSTVSPIAVWRMRKFDWIYDNPMCFPENIAFPAREIIENQATMIVDFLNTVDFLGGKPMKIRKLCESSMLARFRVGEVLLAPLMIRRVLESDPRRSMADAGLGVEIPGHPELLYFVVESKSRSTPESIQSAIRNAKRAATYHATPQTI